MTHVSPRTALAALAATALTVATPLAAVAPAQAHGDDAHHRTDVANGAAAPGTTGTSVPVAMSDNVEYLQTQPGSAGISGCFLASAPLFVVSNLDSIKVFDVSDRSQPRLLGVMPDALFENEAMNCGERRTPTGTQRFALLGVDLVQANPGDIQHANLGGGELVIVDVTDPTAPVVRSRAPGSTSTHTVACVRQTDCTYAYSAGSGGRFSIFDLRDLDHPVEIDSDAVTPGVQGFRSPTAGHKWNFDGAGYGTHTGFNGTSAWDVSTPRRPRLVTTTGEAGRGTDARYPGYNDFIHHNSFRPNAAAFRPLAPPSLANGNVLLVTEEDYEQTDCSLAGSFQTWWVKRLDGTKGAIVPLDKVELADLGTFPLPVGAFCSAHWFDYHQSGIVAAGFYGGGSQFLDVRDPKDIKSFGYAAWGVSEVWDTMWVPVYRADGTRADRRTNTAYGIDLVRGLDVYQVNGLPPAVTPAPLPATAPAARTGMSAQGATAGTAYASAG